MQGRHSRDYSRYEKVAFQAVTLQPPDGGYGWVVVFASFWINFLMTGMIITFSVLLVDLTEFFDQTKSTVGWIGSIHTAAAAFAGIIAGTLVRRYGCRPVCLTGGLLSAVAMSVSAAANSVYTLYITFGFICGVGHGLMMLSSIVIVQQYFKKHRALAAGLSLSGHSIGAFASSPLFRVVSDYYGWRGAMLIYGAVVLHVLPLAILLEPATMKMLQTRRKMAVPCPTATKSFCRDLWDFSVLKEPMFLLFIACNILMQTGNTTYYQQSPSRAVSRGINKLSASFLPSIIGLCSTCSRWIFCFVANLKCVNRTLQFMLGAMAASIVSLLSPIAGDSFYIHSIFAGLYGVTLGSYMTILPTVLVDLLGVEKIAKSQAWLQMTLGISFLGSLPFTGFLFDVTRNYDIPFLVTGSLQVIGSTLAFTIFLLKRRRDRKQDETLDAEDQRIKELSDRFYLQQQRGQSENKDATDTSNSELTEKSQTQKDENVSQKQKQNFLEQTASETRRCSQENVEIHT